MQTEQFFCECEGEKTSSHITTFFPMQVSDG
jgi:hypothetical protein